MKKHSRTLIFVIAGFILAGLITLIANSYSPASVGSDVTTQGPATSTGATAGQAYTLAEVRAHASAQSCWTAVNGGVYDVTSWINQHPGGAQAILSMCGKDGSAAFNGQHGGQRRPAAELATFKIGTLAQ